MSSLTNPPNPPNATHQAWQNLSYCSLTDPPSLTNLFSLQPDGPTKYTPIATHQAWQTHQIQILSTAWPMQPAKPRVWCKLTNKSTNHRLGISINQNASQCIPRRNAFVTNLILVIHQCDPSTARRLQSLFSQLSQSFINFSLCWRIFLLILTFVLAFAWAFQSWALVVVTLSFTPVVGLDSPPPTFCYKNIILGTVPRFIFRLLDLINTILLEICAFWKMKRIRDEMLGRLAIICRSCWDNAERGGESPRAGGRYGNELRNLSLSNGMLPHSLGHHHCHHWHHSLRHHHRSLSTYLLEPGVLSRCRLFLNQFETWRIKRFRIVLVLKSVKKCKLYKFEIQKIYLKCSRNKKKTCVRVRPVFFARVRFSSGVGYLRWNQIKSDPVF